MVLPLLNEAWVFKHPNDLYNTDAARFSSIGLEKL